MAKFKFTNKAVYDLTQIWNYTLNKWSEDQADKYYNMLIENCKEVAINPDLGKFYSGVTKNLLGFKAGRHIIFYRMLEENEVEITRILHEQMDIESRIKEK
ncbi:MAG: type II toxin-antitoxin system RelE/ParE family toxin [Bacteroidales bacterium]|nr:type II toxin-antitoxin system RelE/ParE family toxin [Bacteroidales bacterium]MCF8389734.1 type II toxin-antitoxin system RelE/ParE family toxin [Bacteroidales bacterium]